MTTVSVNSFTAEQELQVACIADTTVQLVNGSADIFGWPMQEGRDVVVIAGRSVAISTMSNATIRITGSFKSTVTENFLAATYGSLLLQLDDDRFQKKLPRILIVGLVDTGKSTLSTHLLNQGVRKGLGMVYVDADLGQSSVTVPGTISGVFVDDFVHFSEGFNRATPLCYFYGETSLTTATVPRYEALASNLRRAIDAVSASRAQGGITCGGIVINTMGWVEGAGYDAIKVLLKIFDVNLVLALGPSVGHVEALTRDFATEREAGTLRILSFPVSPGVTPRDRKYRAQARSMRVHAYFHGAITGEFTPHKLVVKASDLKFFWACAQPSRTKDEPLPTFSVPVDAKERKKLQGALCAVLNATTVDDVIRNTNVAGFCVILTVDEGFVELLVPNSDPLPSPYLLVSSTVKLDDALTKYH